MMKPKCGELVAPQLRRKNMSNTINEMEKAHHYFFSAIETGKQIDVKEKEGHRIYLTAENALKEQIDNRWIPVSERLPNSEPSYISGTTYFVTLNTGVVRFAKYKESKWIGEFERLYGDSEIVAWKKNVKPEPYKECDI